MSQSLVEPPKVTAGLAKVISQIHKLEAIEHDVIALLPSLTDDEVIETRNTARLLFASAWKIEVACDAEIWERTKRKMGGRGQKDADESGIMAAVNKRADELGCSARTVQENYRIYKRFKKTLASTFNSLDDKGFYQAALQSPDPDAAIEAFAQKKIDNPYFRVADAWRDVKAQKEQEQKDREKVAGAVRNMQQKVMIAHCDESIAIQRQLKERCPIPKIGDPVYSSMIEELEDIKHNIQTSNIEVALQDAIKKGYKTIQDMASFTGLAQHDVRRVVRQMVEKEMIEVRSVEESRQDGRRGVMVDLYAVNPNYEVAGE